MPAARTRHTSPVPAGTLEWQIQLLKYAASAVVMMRWHDIDHSPDLVDALGPSAACMPAFAPTTHHVRRPPRR